MIDCDKETNFDIIVYHAGCPDGIASLWCATFFTDIKIKYPCIAGKNPIIDVTDKNILFVDICPQADYLLSIADKAKYIAIFDHHITSINILKDIIEQIKSKNNILLEIDINRAGCQITWDYFAGKGSLRPEFVEYIADRDLWTWKLPNSKEYNIGLKELGYLNDNDLSKLTNLNANPNEKINLIQFGSCIDFANRKHLEQGANNAIQVSLIHDNKMYRIWLGGNINPGLRSEFGALLCNKKLKDEFGSLPDFSATWQYNPASDEWWISLRGIKDISPDLAVISQKYGGGGHALAAGFTIKSPQNLRDIFIFDEIK